MRVMKPSTCGCTVVDRRDFTVPTNSEVCATGRVARVIASTGMGGGAPGAALLVQAAQLETMRNKTERLEMVMVLNREGELTRARLQR
jgi:hypothetical protein